MSVLRAAACCPAWCAQRWTARSARSALHSALGSACCSRSWWVLRPAPPRHHPLATSLLALLHATPAYASSHSRLLPRLAWLHSSLDVTVLPCLCLLQAPMFLFRCVCEVAAPRAGKGAAEQGAPRCSHEVPATLRGCASGACSPRVLCMCFPRMLCMSAAHPCPGAQRRPTKFASIYAMGSIMSLCRQAGALAAAPAPQRKHFASTGLRALCPPCRPVPHTAVLPFPFPADGPPAPAAPPAPPAAHCSW